MRTLIYLIEFIGVVIVVFGINYFLKALFNKKFNSITSAIFSFLATLFIAFIVSPYILSFPNPSFFYLPIISIIFVLDTYKAMKNG